MQSPVSDRSKCWSSDVNQLLMTVSTSMTMIMVMRYENNVQESVVWRRMSDDIRYSNAIGDVTGKQIQKMYMVFKPLPNQQ